jgi:hypothetical protein
MPHQIRHHSIRCRADEYGAAWHVMSDDTEVLAYTREQAFEAWKADKEERAASRRQESESQELLF